MFKPIVLSLIVALASAGAAHAQYGGGEGGSGGGGGGGGGGHGHHGGRSPSSSPTPSATPDTPRPHRDIPANQVEITGVVRAIDPAGSRITIAYEPVEALGWPAGVMPFVASSTAILNSASVGEKVRFRLDSEQISDLKPF